MKTSTTDNGDTNLSREFHQKKNGKLTRAQSCCTLFNLYICIEPFLIFWFPIVKVAFLITILFVLNFAFNFSFNLQYDVGSNSLSKFTPYFCTPYKVVEMNIVGKHRNIGLFHRTVMCNTTVEKSNTTQAWERVYLKSLFFIGIFIYYLVDRMNDIVL